MKCPFKFGNYDFEGAEDCIGAECGMFKLCNANDAPPKGTFQVSHNYGSTFSPPVKIQGEQDSRDSRIRKGLGYKDVPPHEPSEATKRFIEELDSELDSSEKLEADALALVDNLRVYGCNYAGDADVEIIGMLDRQAAITRHETIKRQEAFCDTCESVTDEQIEGLTAERDELQAKVDGYVEALEKLGCSVLANGTVFWPSDCGASCSELQKQVDELTAELEAARNAHAQAEHEAVILREKLGRALDYAHEITSVGGDC